MIDFEVIHNNGTDFEVRVIEECAKPKCESKQPVHVTRRIRELRQVQDNVRKALLSKKKLS